MNEQTRNEVQELRDNAATVGRMADVLLDLKCKLIHIKRGVSYMEEHRGNPRALKYTMEIGWTGPSATVSADTQYALPLVYEEIDSINAHIKEIELKILNLLRIDPSNHVAAVMS